MSSVAASASAGPALKVDEKAVEVMRAVGIDLPGQRPEALTQRMVWEADIVVTMGCGADVCKCSKKNRGIENNGPVERTT